MNALYKETLQWVGDGSDGSTLTQTGNDDDAVEVIIASKTSGTPFNVRLDSEKASVADYYLEVKITQLKGNLSLGCVSQDEFKAGWKCRGMFYNGNLTNGSGALSVSWGPRFEVGDSLGIRVSRSTSTSDTLEVAFYKNGEFLGTGFRLAGTTTIYCPCLHISGSCTVTVVIPEQLPSTELKVETPTGFFGDWKIDNAWEGAEGQPLEIPNRKPLKLSLSKDKKAGDKTINIGCKIGNQMNGQAEIIEEAEKSISVKTGPYMMTRMMPPPEFRALENLISTKEITKMELNEDDTQLTLSGPEMKVQCSRFVRTPEALTKY